MSSEAPPNPHAPEALRALLHELYVRYGASVHGRCRYLLRDRAAADDALHDVFAKAIEHYPRFRQEASPLTWLMTVATHHCLNLLRSARAPWHDTFAQEVRAAPQADDAPSRLEDREQVRHLLRGLDVETQAMVVHYYVDEMTLKEISLALGRSIPTIRKRLAAFAVERGKEQP